MRESDKDKVEILFVVGSSRDRKGKRVIVREGEVENYLWPGQEIDAPDLSLMGVNIHQKEQIIAFLENGS